MRSILAAAAVLAPFSVFATPIQDFDFLIVDYEGTVDLLQPTGLGFANLPRPPQIGDRVSGSLRLDLRLVPPDTLPDDPRRAAHAPDRERPDPDWPSFVTGHTALNDVQSFDRLRLQDNVAGRDSFEIGDIDASRALGPFDFRLYSQSLILNVSSTSLDFIHGDGPLQAFEITSDQFDLDQPSFGTRGYSEYEPSSEDWFAGTVRFAIDKLKVTPGRCSAP